MLEGRICWKQDGPDYIITKTGIAKNLATVFLKKNFQIFSHQMDFEISARVKINFSTHKPEWRK